MDPADVSLPAALAPRYVSLRRLGSGGFGRVVLSRDTRLDRLVAIKVMRASLPDLELRLRFEREARITARLQHPAIVKVFDFGLGDDGVPFIVYEYVEGRTLAAAAEAGPLAPATLRRFGAALAGALAAAHREGVLHRDVKPENVLIRANGEAVLADFGIARVEEGSTLRTRQGIVLGTPDYLAPEVFTGAEPSPASDQFALGATLLRVAYGTAVYAAPDLAGMLRQARDGQLGRIPAARRGADPGFEAAVTRALEADPRRRFPDLAAMAEAFEAKGAPPVEVAPADPTVVLDAKGKSPSTTRALGPVRDPGPPPPPGPGGRVPRGPALLLAGVVALVLAWGLGGDRPPGPVPEAGGGEVPEPPKRPSPPPGDPVEAKARELCLRFGWEPAQAPRLVVEAMLRGLDEEAAKPVFEALEAMSPGGWRDAMAFEYLAVRGENAARALERTARVQFRAGIPDWATARARVGGLSVRLLARSLEAGGGSPLAGQVLDADVAWTEKELARKEAAWALAMRAELWETLARRLHPRPTLSQPALERAEELIGELAPRLGELDPEARLLAVVLFQRVAGQLGDTRRVRVVVERLAAQVLAPLAGEPRAHKFWWGVLSEFQRETGNAQAFGPRVVPMQADPVGLPLPAGRPGTGRHRAGQGWAIIDDPPGPDPVEVAWEPGGDPHAAFREASARAVLEGRELADAPALRAALLGGPGGGTGTGEALVEVLLWPRLVLGMIRELEAAGKRSEALRLARRSLGEAATWLGQTERLRRFGSGAWGALQAWALEAEAALDTPESRARAAARAREIVVRAIRFPEPLTKSEARLFAAGWARVDRSTLGEPGPITDPVREGDALARAAGAP